MQFIPLIIFKLNHIAIILSKSKLVLYTDILSLYIIKNIQIILNSFKFSNDVSAADNER